MEKINVLYVCIDPSLGGSTASLFNMIEGLKDGVHSIVLFPELGTGVEFFKKHGIECYVMIRFIIYNSCKYITRIIFKYFII